jgi:YVTN family beta-propeller protein
LPHGERDGIGDQTNIRNGVISRPVKHVPVGTEPYGLAVTPNGHKLYVSNARSNWLSVIDTQTDVVIKTIENVGIEPRGLAISNDGDDDDGDETVYVAQFLSLPIAGKVDGEDDSKRAFVTRVSTATDSVEGTIEVNPLQTLPIWNMKSGIADRSSEVFTFGTFFPDLKMTFGLRQSFKAFSIFLVNALPHSFPAFPGNWRAIFGVAWVRPVPCAQFLQFRCPAV